MIKKVAFGVGLRYAFSRRSSISFISTIAVAGLGLSVAVLVVVISVINGFEREFKDRVFGMLPHLTLYGREPLTVSEQALRAMESLPGVIGVVPFIQGAGLAAVSEAAVGIMISGIDDTYSQVSDMSKHIVSGTGRLEAGKFEVLLGAGVARELNVTVGDKVALVLPSATVTPAGLFPRQKRFRVAGIVRSQSEIDSRAAFIHEADARRLFRLGEHVHGYQLRVDDLFAVNSIARQAIEILGADTVFPRSWMRTHGNIYRAIAVQKTTMFVLLSFLVAVAAFNLVSTLVMVVDQRSGDIAILRTLGSDGGTIVLAFLLLGICLGLVGIGTGLAVGSLISVALPGFYSWVSATFSLDLMNQYFVTYLPVEIRLSDLTGITLTALALCVLSTLYPAWRAARLQPSEVLAHE